MFWHKQGNLERPGWMSQPAGWACVAGWQHEWQHVSLDGSPGSQGPQQGAEAIHQNGMYAGHAGMQDSGWQGKLEAQPACCPKSARNPKSWPGRLRVAHTLRTFPPAARVCRDSFPWALRDQGHWEPALPLQLRLPRPAPSWAACVLLRSPPPGPPSRLMGS